MHCARRQRNVGAARCSAVRMDLRSHGRAPKSPMSNSCSASTACSANPNGELPVGPGMGSTQPLKARDVSVSEDLCKTDAAEERHTLLPDKSNLSRGPEFSKIARSSG